MKTLTHIVLFKRKPEVQRRPDYEKFLVECMRELGARIQLIRSWRISANELKRPISWDYVLESKFDDVRALEAFLQHPAYLALVVILKNYFDWAACDYTLG